MSQGPSRRKFLKRVVKATAVGLLAPAVVRRGALAAVGRPSASERIGIGFIGVGSRGSSHLGSFAGRPETQVVAVCDVDASMREKAAKRVGSDCGKHADYRELLDRKDVDAVVISTPDHWHAAPVIHACESGKDIYCEKPLSLTIVQGRKMVEAVRSYGRVFQTGSQQRSASEFRKACELVRSGRIGKIQSVLVSVWGSSKPCHLPAEPVPVGLDWRGGSNRRPGVLSTAGFTLIAGGPSGSSRAAP